jgi:hypothetical protein
MSIPVFRLAIRHEGKMIKAYLAEPHTMDEAIFLASISKNLCDRDERIFLQWKECMKEVIRIISKEALGADVEGFDEHVAPEHERSGNS